MIDFNFIGKEGIIIQFEDIVSLTGYNIANYLKAKGFQGKLQQVSNKDLLISYFERDEYDIAKWLEQFGVTGVTPHSFIKSISAWQPNLLYSYKIFQSAYNNGIKNLKIYSDVENDVIREFVKHYQIPIEYCHTDLKASLGVNMTFYTSSQKNIELCKTFGIPIALVIIDDFMYLKDIALPKYIDSLQEKNIFVNFTSVIGAGFI